MMNHKELMELIKAYNDGLEKMLALRIGLVSEETEKEKKSQEKRYLSLSQIAEYFGYYYKSNTEIANTEAILSIINEIIEIRDNEHSIYVLPSECYHCEEFDDNISVWYDTEILPFIKKWLFLKGWPSVFSLPFNNEVGATLLTPKYHEGMTLNEIESKGYKIVEL